MVRIKKSFFISFAIFLQLCILVAAVWGLSGRSIYLYAVFETISLITVIRILYRQQNPSYKISWIIAILLFPGFGVLFYFFLGSRSSIPAQRRRLSRILEEATGFQKQDPGIVEEVETGFPGFERLVEYIYNVTGRPVFAGTETKLLASGEEKLEYLLKELDKAEKFIHMEYFIISLGEMWSSIEKILQRKAAEGVEVRIIYDDVGSMDYLPKDFKKRLEAMGIKVGIFNPTLPVLNGVINFRDHRKIAVIDGKTGFTGGTNLGDEYINVWKRYGHWKDTHVMLAGRAVDSLSLIFISNWRYITGEKLDYKKYVLNYSCSNDGFVQAFEDGPFDFENTSENVYLQLINRARRYIYITTPYLVPDNEMVTALCIAAKSGVDVRIITPAIPDKWYVHMVSRSYYDVLLQQGIKIYEYTPGFIHSKVILTDDCAGMVGTVNMDYRSFFLHFECASLMIGSSALATMKEDLLHCFSESKEILFEDRKKRPWYIRQLEMVLRIFAPMM